MSIRRRIPYHTLGEMIGTVSTLDGYALYRCVRCGHEVRTIPSASNTFSGGCLVSVEAYKDWQAEQQEKPNEAVRKPLGWWSDVTVEKAVCPRCATSAQLVPRTGHRLSVFWRLEKDDDCVLVWCPKGCTEA